MEVFAKELIKVLVVGSDKDGVDIHHWMEISVSEFGSDEVYDSEEKACIIYEQIPSKIVRFSIEYIWQSKLSWQSDSVKNWLNDWGASR